MNGVLGILLAQRSRLDNLSDAFRSRPDSTDKNDILHGLLIVAVLIVGVWLLGRLFTMREERRTYNSPLRLFLSLCKAHGLRWSQQWLLWRVARSQRLENPAQLFVEPERFNEENLCPALRSRAAELQILREQLFAAPAGDSVFSQPCQSPPVVASMPLFPTIIQPTLDVPPWTTGVKG